MHFLTKSAEHVAWLVAQCQAEDIATIEAEPDAEEAWLGVLYGVAGNFGDYAASCTPGYYNSEQNWNAKAARNLVYAGSLLDYAGYLERWRDEGAFTGTKVVRSDD